MKAGASESWARFVAEIAPASAAGDLATLRARRHLFGALATSDWLLERVRETLSAHARDPLHAPLQPCTWDEWAVVDDAHLRLVAIRAPVGPSAEARHLHGWPFHRLVAALGPHPVHLRRFRHPRPHPPEIFDPEQVLEDCGERVLQRGDVEVLEAWRDVSRLELHQAPTWALELQTRPVVGLRWSYDSRTLRPVAPVAADPATNRVEFALWLLVQLGDAHAIEACRALLAHPQHHVRWTAARAGVELDRDAGLALVRHLVDDPHPHVRRAARAASDRLSGGP